MSKVSDLQYKRQQYYNLKEKVNNTISSLKKALDKLDDADKKVVNGYSIDENRGDDGYLTNKKNDTKSIYNDLVNSVLPAINSKIYSLGKEIEAALTAKE